MNPTFCNLAIRGIVPSTFALGVGCSGGTTSPPPAGTGGASGSGGSSATGGVNGSGGSSATGGVVSSGGDHTAYPDNGTESSSWGPQEVWTFLSQF